MLATVYGKSFACPQNVNGSQHSKIEIPPTTLECGETQLPPSRCLHAWWGQACPWAHKAHLTTDLWMVVALLHSGEVNLPLWWSEILCRGHFTQSKQQRVQRWLHNPRTTFIASTNRCFEPL